MNNLTLEEFLLNNSSINKEFIRDFFGVQNNKEYIIHKPFTIDLDTVVYWLNSRKDILKDTLIKSYKINIDYILLPVNPEQKNDVENRGGYNKQIILLTSECFKRLCMLSRTENAEQVRQYYLELEKLVDKYKDYIIQIPGHRFAMLGCSDANILLY